MLFRALYGTLDFETIYQSMSKFSNNSLTLCYSVRVLYPQYGNKSSSEKLNVHKAFEFMSLLGALILYLK